MSIKKSNDNFNYDHVVFVVHGVGEASGILIPIEDRGKCNIFYFIVQDEILVYYFFLSSDCFQ